MTFIWRDRAATDFDLASPQLILDEAAAIESEIDADVSSLEIADAAERDRARQAITLRVQRLSQLDQDLKRWNDYASEQTIATAVELISQIDGLPQALGDVMLVVAVHDERDRLSETLRAEPYLKEVMLSQPMTSTQRRAIAMCDDAEAVAATMTRGQATDWLNDQPRFARSATSDGGWFAWIDRHEHAHRLVDALPIEREIVSIAAELAGLKPMLDWLFRADDLFVTVERAFGWMDRLTVLQQDLVRFGHEAEARDLAECKKWAADWRSRRSRT